MHQVTNQEIICQCLFLMEERFKGGFVIFTDGRFAVRERLLLKSFPV